MLLLLLSFNIGFAQDWTLRNAAFNCDNNTCGGDLSWQSLAYGNGLYVAVAGSGTGNRVMTSPDGINWTARSSAADLSWRSVSYGNGLFVAVAITGTGNRVMTSPDGINWTIRTSAADNSWNSITYGNGLFVAVASTGAGNRVMTSPDGISWTIRTSADNNSWNSITYGNGLFVAVASTGTGNRVMTSPDGITWTSRATMPNNQWIGLTYGNGLFVSVAEDGLGNRVMTSPDGITWTSRTSSANNFWFGLTYGNGLFVAVASSGTGNRVMTSPDGITWTSRVSATDNNWRNVAYANGQFVAVAYSGTGNRVMTSPDGINWTSQASAADNDWKGICYGNGLWVAVATSGTGNRVMTSPDGITWTSRVSAEDLDWNNVSYGNGLFVAVATNGIMTSPDGINWTSRTSPANLRWITSSYANGAWMAVSNSPNGTIGNRVMTSTDGINWTSKQSADDNLQWTNIAYGNGRWVSVAETGASRVMTMEWAKQIAVNTGNNQSATVGSAVATAPSVIVKDGNNNPVAGVSITFSVASGGGSITGATAITNATGIAILGSWTLGTTAGANRLNAAITGSNPEISTSFSATGQAGTATQIAINAGNNQTATTGTAVPVVPAAIVKDVHNNPVSGVNVSFSVASGGGSVTSASATTDAAGIATPGSWTLGTTVGTNTLTATSTGLTGSPLTFTATGTAGAATQMTINTGNNQSTTVGSELFFAPSVLVQDANNNGVQGVPVTIKVQTGSGTMYPALISNITPDYSEGGSTLTQGDWKAILFTNGTSSVKIRGISLVLNNITTTYPANVGVKVAIYSVAGGNPDLQLATSDDRIISLSNSKTWAKFLLNSELQLSPGTTYALVVKGLDNTGFKWANTRPSVNPMMYGTASYVGAKFTDNGAWVNGNGGNGFALVIDPGETNALNLTTSAAGIASLGAWTMGNKAGTNSLTATLTGNNPELTRIITAEAISSPEKPTQLSATPSDGQISLSFIPAADGGTVITNYEYSLDEGKTWIAFNPAKISSPLTITNLNNGTRYPVQIRALNGVGAGPASDLVYATPSKSIADLSITLLDVTYNGEEQKVKPLIKNGETILIENTDYTLNYSSNINAGTGNVGITGINRYSGQRQESFIINKANLIIVADNINKVFGTTDPAFTYRLSGLKPNDRESDVLSGNLTRQAGEKPGNYIISQGTLNSNNNYSISFTNAELKITAAQILSFIDFGVIETAWGKNPDLPAQVRVLTTNGQFTLMNISWNVSGLNIFARGVYGISGTITLIDGIINPLGIRPTATIKVLPKPAPLQLTLSNNSFEGSTSSFLILVGTFIIDDPVDRNHTLSLTGTLLDNKYFIIKNNELYWNSRDRAEGKTNFNILVILSDRDGNSIEKKFQINRIRKSIEQIRIPNTFTPNGDGMNDTWGLEEMRFFQGATIHIFERGGERLFHTDNPDIRWDGTYKGKHLPTGTYYWKIEIKETGEIRKGILNLIK